MICEVNSKCNKWVRQASGKLSSFIYFANYGIKTILFKKRSPILGTVIVTDKCNLKCKHCSVNNITAIVHPYRQIKNEMQQLYEMGV